MADEQQMVYSDTLMHTKDEDGTIITMLPITRYENVLCNPRVVSNENNAGNAPFYFLVENVIED